MRGRGRGGGGAAGHAAAAGRVARAHHRPEVAALAVGDLGGAVVAKALDDLGRDVLRRADEPGEPPLAARRRAAKVDELDDGRALRREDEVLRLEVAVDDVDRVHVVDRERHLREDRQRVVLLEGPLREQVLEQLAAAEALHHHVHVLLVAAHLDHLHDVRVAELLREGALHPQRLVHLVVLELGEREHLDRHLRRAAPLRLPQVHCRLRARAELVLEGVPRRDVLERHVGEARRPRLRVHRLRHFELPRLTGARAKFAAASIFAGVRE